jgi:hypothetical protein
MLLPWALAVRAARPPAVAQAEAWMTLLLGAGALLVLVGTPAAQMGAMLLQAMAWSCGVLPGHGLRAEPAERLRLWLPPLLAAALVPALEHYGIALLRAVYVAAGALALAGWLLRQLRRPSAPRPVFQTLAVPAWSAHHGEERRAAAPPCP